MMPVASQSVILSSGKLLVSNQNSFKNSHLYIFRFVYYLDCSIIIFQKPVSFFSYLYVCFSFHLKVIYKRRDNKDGFLHLFQISMIEYDFLMIHSLKYIFFNKNFIYSLLCKDVFILLFLKSMFSFLLFLVFFVFFSE